MNFFINKKYNVLNFILLSFLSILFSSCTAVKSIEHLPKSYTSESQKLVIFMDGTANDEGSYTNVFKLRNLVTLQSRTDIKSVYIAGVGTGYRHIGKMIGLGFQKDIKQTYEFLTMHYKSQKNKIYIFGFSRGAYAARILAGFIQLAGIPNLSGLTKKQRKKLIEDIYDEYKLALDNNRKKSIGKQRRKIESIVSNQLMYEYVVNLETPIKIEFAGLWDSVAALAIPNVEEKNILETRQIDQLCNVKEVAHALSLDDDRARIFTPIFLTEKAAEEQCINELVNKRSISQVFFSGAHSDVGGGYLNTDIDGISLNWMINKISGDNKTKLLPKNTKVYADTYGITHDPEADVWKYAYHCQHRNISKYYKLLGDSFTLHQSVIDRIKNIPRKCHEIQWKEENTFINCFTQNEDNTFTYNKNIKECKLTINNDDKYVSSKLSKKTSIILCTKNSSLPCKIDTIDIDSTNESYKTGVYLDKNKNYRFEIKITKQWNDDGTCSTPEDGRRIARSNTNVIMEIGQYLVTPLEHAAMAGYTELIGEVQKETMRLGQMVKDNTIFSPNENGELIVKINEPNIGEFVYKNNNGKLKLTVIQTK